MARPRVIKLGEKTITLQGFSTEEANKFEETLSGVSSTARGNPEATVTAQEPPKAEASTLEGTAIGYSFNKERKQYELVKVKYDPKTNYCVIAETKDIGDFRNLAISNFKVILYENKLV